MQINLSLSVDYKNRFNVLNNIFPSYKYVQTILLGSKNNSLHRKQTATTHKQHKTHQQTKQIPAYFLHSYYPIRCYVSYVVGKFSALINKQVPLTVKFINFANRKYISAQINSLNNNVLLLLNTVKL